MTVYDLARHGLQFDLVLFMGVLYHLRYPLLGLDIVSAATRRLLVFQTLTSGETPAGGAAGGPAAVRAGAPPEPDWPAMAFVEHRLAGDQTNWWVPNTACVEALVRSSGLEVVARPGHEIYLCGPAGSGGGAAGHVREALGS